MSTLETAIKHMEVARITLSISPEIDLNDPKFFSVILAINTVISRIENLKRGEQPRA